MQETQEMQVWFLGWEDPLEEEMAVYSSILARKILWTEEPGRLQSMGSQRVGHDWATEHACTHAHTHTHTHKSEYRGLFLKLSFVNLDIVFSDVRSLIYEVYILYISLSIYCHSIIYILHYMPIFYCCIHRYYQGNIFINYSRLVIYCVTFSRP